MKKICLLLLGICLTFIACGKKDEKRKPVTEDNESDFLCDYATSNGFFTEDYALYYSNHGRLQFFDVATKSDVVFCFDPACQHKMAISRKGVVIEKGCIAYEYSAGAPVMLRDDKCVFLQDNGEVYTSDRSGENRRLIGSLPSYIIDKKSVCFSENALFMCYDNPYELLEVKDSNGNSSVVLGEQKETRTCGIFLVDLTDGGCTEIFHRDNYEAIVGLYEVQGTHLYFQYSESDCPYTDFVIYESEGSSDEVFSDYDWKEAEKHQWTEIYDYDISTGELKCILPRQQYGTAVFCKDFFAIGEQGTTGLYRYNGERFRQLGFEIAVGVRTNSNRLVCKGKDNTDEYRLIDENTGAVLQSVAVPSGEMMANVIIGNSVYGNVLTPDGYAAGYISEDDFWAGNFCNAVPFHQFEELTEAGAE